MILLRGHNEASDGLDIEGEDPKRKGRHVATQMENRNWNTNRIYSKKQQKDGERIVKDRPPIIFV